MEKLLEVIRRLALVFTWLIGGAVGLSQIFNGFEYGNNERIWHGVLALVVTYFVQRVINWVLLKEDKPFQD